MSATLTTASSPAVLTAEHTDTISQLVLGGDLSKMDASARVRYYTQLCQSLNLNPLTQPFQILKLSGKEVLYATKSCTEQLRKLWGVSVTNMEHRQEGDVYLVVAYVVDSTGRTDVGTGAVPVTNMKGEALANAFMKAETKAKRRATLSLCGLGILDETELDTLPQAQRVSLPAAPEIGTSAEVVEVPASPAPEQVAREVAGARERIQHARSTRELQEIWQKLPRSVAGQLETEKNEAKQRIASQVLVDATSPVREEGSYELVAEFRDKPTVDGEAPQELASEEQKQEITRLCNHLKITRKEKTALMLVINRLDCYRATHAINKLRRAIATREGSENELLAGIRADLHRKLTNYGEQLHPDRVQAWRVVLESAVATAEELQDALDELNLELSAEQAYAA